MELHSTSNVEIIVMVRQGWRNAVRDVLAESAPSLSRDGDPWQTNKLHWATNVYEVLSRSIQAVNSGKTPLIAICVDGMRASDAYIFDCLEKIGNAVSIAFKISSTNYLASSTFPAVHSTNLDDLPNAIIKAVQQIETKISQDQKDLFLESKLQSTAQPTAIKNQPERPQSPPSKQPKPTDNPDSQQRKDYSHSEAKNNPFSLSRDELDALLG